MKSMTELGVDLLKLAEQKRGIEIQMENIKDDLAHLLEKDGQAEIVVPDMDEAYVLHIKTNIRFTKKFDKEGLGAEIGRDRDELDYHGISNLVEQGYLKTNTVAKYLHDGESKFVSVRRKKAGK